MFADALAQAQLLDADDFAQYGLVGEDLDHDRSVGRAPAEIRPFMIEMPEAELELLRDRIAATRWPDGARDDRSQGVQSATIRARRYWATEYDWRTCEARLNALPQFMTEIDGVDIHFIHVRSPHENALPLIMTHGWPGSIIELLEVVGPLTDPTAHGGRAEDAFHLVLPSLPGYGFSGEPTELGWDPGRVAQRLGGADARLGYTRYVAQGGDVGALVTDAMGRQAPEGLVGIHTNLLVTALAAEPRPRHRGGTRGARRARHVPDDRLRLLPGAGHPAADDRLRPPGFTRRPGGLDARPRHGQLPEDLPRLSRRAAVGQLTREHILDNITLYWLTGTGASAARAYWEKDEPRRAAGHAPPPVSIPAGFTTFPGEIFRAPRSWVEQAYPNLDAGRSRRRPVGRGRPRRSGPAPATRRPASTTNGPAGAASAHTGGPRSPSCGGRSGAACCRRLTALIRAARGGGP